MTQAVQKDVAHFVKQRREAEQPVPVDAEVEASASTSATGMARAQSAVARASRAAVEKEASHDTLHMYSTVRAVTVQR